MTQTWQPPATPVASPARLPIFRKSGGKYLLLAGGAAIAGLIAISALSSGTNDAPATPSSENENFYVQAGWSASRLGDLSVKMQRDDGVSQDVARCAMRNIAGVMTWLEWQAAGTSGQFSLIRAAETGC